MEVLGLKAMELCLSIRCWMTFSSNQYGAKSWLIMNLWQFSEGKLPQLHNVTGRIDYDVIVCEGDRLKPVERLFTLGDLGSSLDTWVWTKEFHGLECTWLCTLHLCSGRQNHCFWDIHVAFVFLLCKLQQGQFSQEKPGLGTGHLEQSFQNLIG